MSDEAIPMEEGLSDLADVVAKVNDPKPCPHCGKEISAAFFAQFKPTKLKMAIDVEDGHRLQAEAIGGVLTNIGKLLKSIARDIGGAVEVLTDGIEFTANRVEFTFLVVEARPKAKKQEKSA